MGKPRGGTKPTAGAGASTGATLTKDEIAVFRGMQKKALKQEARKAESKTSKKLIGKLVAKGVVFKDAGGNSLSLDDYEEDSDSTTDSSSDGGHKKSKKAKKKAKQSLKKAEEEIAKAEDERKAIADKYARERGEWGEEKALLVAKSKELEELRTKVDAKLATPDGATSSANERKMTAEEWRAQQAAAKAAAQPEPSPQKKYGIFASLISSSARPSASKPVANLLSLFDTKLQLAEDRRPLREGVSVTAESEKVLKHMASEIVGAHMTNVVGSNECLELKRVLTKYLPSNSSKSPITIITAILRALLSREVRVTEEELQCEISTI